MIFRREYKIEGYVKSDVGTVRENNEDNFLLGRLINRDSRAKQEASFSTWAIGEWNCFVFDGIGGGEKGELASLFSAQVFEGKGKKLKECHSYKEVELVLQKAFLEANNRIILAGRNSPVCGTTGTILVTDGIAAKVFHVGDSRCCLCREGENYRLTKDQTTAQLKLDLGIYRSREEATQRERHQLRRACRRRKGSGLISGKGMSFCSAATVSMISAIPGIRQESFRRGEVSERWQIPFWRWPCKRKAMII